MQSLIKIIHQLLALIFVLLLVCIILVCLLIFGVPDLSAPGPKVKNNIQITTVANKIKDTVTYWKAPDTDDLAHEPAKDLILYGKDLIVHTAAYFGPKGLVNKNATNGMHCQNCHLDAGTKVFGNNYSAVHATYPKYRARSGAIEDIYKRVNDCFERSLNGKALAIQSKEMQAITAYINWLGKDVLKDKKPAGSGLKELTFLDRAANPGKGKNVYVQKCVSCHQTHGGGLWNAEKTAFVYPPLWGNKSYNTGAGLYRLSNFAKFVKYNMPLGATHKQTQLNDEESWDVAAYVNSQLRPQADFSKDWPDIAEKPFDHPFGPYADGFSETQHKFGPFKPIREKLNAMNKVKKS